MESLNIAQDTAEDDAATFDVAETAQQEHARQEPSPPAQPDMISRTHADGTTHYASREELLSEKGICPALREAYRDDPAKAQGMLALAAFGHSLRKDKTTSDKIETSSITPAKLPATPKLEKLLPDQKVTSKQPEHQTSSPAVSETVTRDDVLTETVIHAETATIPEEPILQVELKSSPLHTPEALAVDNDHTADLPPAQQPIAVPTFLEAPTTLTERVENAAVLDTIEATHDDRTIDELDAQELRIEAERPIVSETSLPSVHHDTVEQAMVETAAASEDNIALFTTENPGTEAIEDLDPEASIVSHASETHVEVAAETETFSAVTEQLGQDVAETYEEFISTLQSPEALAETHQALGELETALEEIEAFDDDPDLAVLFQVDLLEVRETELFEAPAIGEEAELLPLTLNEVVAASSDETLADATTIEAASERAVPPPIERSQLATKIAEVLDVTVTPEAEIKIEAAIEKLVVSLQHVYEASGKPYDIGELRATAKQLVFEKLQSIAEQARTVEQSDAFDRGTHENLIRLLGQVKQLRVATNGLHRFIGQFAVQRLFSSESEAAAA